MSNRFSEVVHTLTTRIEEAKNNVAKRIIGKFNPEEVEVIDQKNPSNNFHSIATYWHVQSKTKLATIEIKFIGAQFEINTWVNEDVFKQPTNRTFNNAQIA